MKLKQRIQVTEAGLTRSETYVHGLTPRHRRKAGSGPPATALIAWIGTDTRLGATTAASHRRETDLPPPSKTSSATIAVAACFVLACGVVLGITAALSDGLVVPLGPRESRQPAVLDQNPAAAPNQAVPNQAVPNHATPPAPPKQGGPGPVGAPVPGTIEPMMGDGPPAPFLPPRPTTKRGNPDEPIDPDKPVDLVAPGAASRPPLSNSGAPGDHDSHRSTDPPGATGQPGSSTTPDDTKGPIVLSNPGEPSHRPRPTPIRESTSDADPGAIPQPVVSTGRRDVRWPAGAQDPAGQGYPARGTHRDGGGEFGGR